MRDAFVRRLTELAAADPRIFLITGDLGFGVLDSFARERPCQFLNAGVAEQNIAGIAAGLALDGRIVFTYSIANFPTLRCLEQLRNDVCYHDANVNVVAIGGGFSYGALGFSHHATEDLAIMRALPNMTVVSPGDDWEAAEAVSTLVRKQGPSYLRLDRIGPDAPRSADDVFELGRARLVRAGDDVAIIATGGILTVALAAADLLAEQGIECRVLSVHTLKPLDAAAIVAAARDTGGIVTVEEHSVIGGLAGAVAETCLECGVPPRAFRRIGLRDGFTTIVGSQDYLRTAYGMDAAAIATAAHALVRTPLSV